MNKIAKKHNIIVATLFGVVLLVMLLMPMFATAQIDGVLPSSDSLRNIEELVRALNFIIVIIVPVSFALAILAFFWGVAVYLFAAGDENAKSRGKRIMTGGVIGLFLIASIWGIVAFIRVNLGISQDDTERVPGLNVPQGSFFN